jgi:hypothetical protein
MQNLCQNLKNPEISHAASDSVRAHPCDRNKTAIFPFVKPLPISSLSEKKRQRDANMDAIFQPCQSTVSGFAQVHDMREKTNTALMLLCDKEPLGATK